MMSNDILNNSAFRLSTPGLLLFFGEKLPPSGQLQ